MRVGIYDTNQATLDIGVADNYYAVLLVGNQLIPRSDPQNNRAESNRVHINGAIVRVTETDGTPNSWPVPIS